MNHLVAKVLSGLLVVALTAGVSLVLLPAPVVQAQGADIVGTLAENGRFNTFVGMLTTAGLVDTLRGPGPFTVFAPTDDAFANLPAGFFDSLMANTQILTRTLEYYIVPGTLRTGDIAALSSATTLIGATLAITRSGNTITVNGALVVVPDLLASNGVIQGIDMVLMPPGPMVCQTDYVVQAGDTLGGIARQFLGRSSAYQQIITATNTMAENDPRYHVIDNPGAISPGWRLCISAVPAAVLPQATIAGTPGPQATATETPAATAVSAPPTATPTSAPPTATATPVPPAPPATSTATSLPPTATVTSVLPTATATPIPPTATAASVPPTATSTPSPHPTVAQPSPTEQTTTPATSPPRPTAAVTSAPPTAAATSSPRPTAEG